ncbi:hypothetical protein LXL04_015856 [Taraxacum kok-saghyz]
MEVQKIVHMNVGNGESSYARNSFLQETVIRKMLPVLKHAIKGMANLDTVLRKCFVMADLGCSTGTNTLLVASIVIDIVLELSKEANQKAPQFQEKRENFGSCVVSATPGSFYGRLFQDESLHLVYSSCAVHWLSQVPEGIENKKSNIYMAKTSPINVFKEYQNQFHTDFKTFLQLRSKEIVHGGRMVLTFLGRSNVDHRTTDDGCFRLFELLAQSLLDMVKEGLVKVSYLNSFNIPNYAPCEDEVKNAIHNEGSFSLDTLNVFHVNWDPYDTDYMKTKDLKEL